MTVMWLLALAVAAGVLMGWQAHRTRRRVPRLPPAPAPHTGRVPGTEPALRVAVVGESTAAGVGVDSHEQALAGQLGQALTALTGRAVVWDAAGLNGADARQVRDDVLRWLPQERQDLIVIALGVNDALALRRPDHWRQELDALCDTLAQRCGPCPMLLTGIPAFERFPSLPWPLGLVLGWQARRLNRTSRRLADDRRDLSFCATRVGGADQFAADGFHPGVEGYAAWGRGLAETAVALVTDASETAAAHA